jgi:hypothetical protein
MYRCPESSRQTGTDIDLTKNFLDELHDPEQFEPLLKDLGVCIAGFVYLNEEAGRAEYGFFGPATGDSRKDYMIPYQDWGWPAPPPKGDHSQHYEKHRRAIDGMFYLHRYHQNPFVRQGHEFSNPEYLQDLPLSADWPLRGFHLTDACRDQHKDFRDTFGLHYVPYGELVAFLLMWRRLLRRLEHSTQQSWMQIDWGGVVTFESDLARIVNDPENFKCGQLSSGTRVDMRWVVEKKDGTSWKSDVDALLLFDRSVDALSPLRLLIGDVCDAPSLSESATVATLGNLADQLLARLEICGLPPQCTAQDDLLVALARLHDVSRFPIIPYYYWNALSRRRRTHAVVPVLGRATRPLRSAGHHGIAGVAVVDIQPLTHFDFTMNRQGRPGHCDLGGGEDEWRLDTLKHLLELVAAPQIDSLYYAQAQKLQVDRDLAENVYAIGHPLKHRLGLINEFLGSQSAALEEGSVANALIWHHRVVNAVECAARTAGTMDFFSSLCQHGRRLDRMASKFVTTKPYKPGTTVRQHLDSFARARWTLAGDSNDLLALDAIVVAPQREVRPCDSIYEDLFFEILFNAYWKSPPDKRELRITLKQIQVLGRASVATYPCILFSNPTTAANECEREEVFRGLDIGDEWSRWPDDPGGPKGGLRLHAFQLRVTGAGDLFAKLAPHAGQWWFSVGVFLASMDDASLLRFG